MNRMAQRIFEDAIDLTGPERRVFIERACGDDEALRREVESLIGSFERAAEFLSEPSISTSRFPRAESGEAWQTPGAFEKPGDMIGRYRLQEEIGSGGFGVVFKAEQTEPVRRSVALKIIRVGMDTRDRIARFDAERQALAMMAHPNIAKVLDAGATGSGRLFFVMELVEGTTITRYAEEQHLGVAERLGLFRQVCSAVQHAHQKGIIHRDIKPSNVLVTTEDGKPVPKVIDFGIAKAIDVRLTDRTLVTEAHQLIGTPAYMSPEQADTSTTDIDTRADVYSLGVLLYELLTGVTPFDSSQMRALAFDELLRMIRQDDPVKPSMRMSQGASAMAAPRRRRDTRRLESTLRGDLDWIVMKCLEKDRTRRYATAQSLSDDVERFLANEPVVAGPPSVGYRARKFYKRNRAGVLMAGMFVTLVMGSAVAVVVQNVRIRQERDDKFNAQGAAQSATANFGLAVISSLNSTQGVFAQDAVRRPLLALDDTIGRTDWRRSPQVEYDMRKALTVCFESLGDTDAAKAQFERLRTIGERVATPHATTCHAIVDQLFDQADARADAGDNAAARAILERADWYLDGIDDRASPRYAKIQASLAATVANEGGRARAEEMLRASIRILEAPPAGDPETLARAKYSLAELLRARGRYGDALAAAKESLELREELHKDAPGHADIIDCFRMLILIEGDSRHADEVCAWIRALLDRMDAWPDEGPERSHRLDAYAAAAYAASAQWTDTIRNCVPPDTESTIEREIATALKQAPAGSADICQAMLAMQMLRALAGDLAGQERWALRAYEMCCRHDRWPEDVTRRSRYLLGGIYMETGRYAAAASMFRDLVEFDRRTRGRPLKGSQDRLEEAQRMLDATGPGNE